MITPLRKALLRGAFCVVLLTLLAGNNAQAATAPAADRIVQVVKVFDGDTVRLADGEHVRLIGINAPEIAHDNRPAEPVALAAQRYLEKLVGGRRVGLVVGVEPRDRHGRLLGNLLVDGEHSAAELLLAKGYGSLIAIPPNIRNLDRLQAAEAHARRAHAGIWGNPYFAPVPVAQLHFRGGAFRFVSGTVEHTGRSRKYTYLDFDHHFSVAVPNADWRTYFGVDPHRFIGRRLVVRGWLTRTARRPMMRVGHPAMLMPAP